MPVLTPWAFVLAVPDLLTTSTWFRDVLGFHVLWEGADDWRLVERDGVRIMLGHCPNDLRPSELGSHSWFAYINVDDLDAWHAEVTSRGASCTPPRNTPYRMREMVVTTPDGHRIVFGQNVPG